MIFHQKLTLISLFFATAATAQAQSVQATVHKAKVRYTQSVDGQTPITNAVTGQLISMDEYSQLTKAEPAAWHLVPDYNELGQPKAYTLRAATPEERATQRFRDRDPAKQPKVGQEIAPFVMTGMDGKSYSSAGLLGKAVVLSFWISLDKPFWNAKQADEFINVLRPYQSTNGLVSLGVLNSEPPKASEQVDVKELPFVPVPNAYGFHNKYHITTVPTIVVIDKSGKVAANLSGPGIFERLGQVLASLPK